MSARAAAACVVALACAACTPMRTTIPPPYELEGKYYDERKLREIAAERCKEAGESPPPHDFTTDGCSAWPDDGYRACCIAHDLRYWCGGSPEDRKAADRELRQCVAGKSSALNSRIMLLGVRLGGGRLVPFPWRWGYGHDWPYRRESGEGEPLVVAPGERH